MAGMLDPMQRLLLVIFATGCLLGAAQDPAIRDAAVWPFSSTSPWNTSLGDQAAFQPISSPRFTVAKGGSVNAVGFSHPVYIAAPSDPEVAVYRSGTDTPFTRIRVPVDAKPDAMGDGHLHIINETRRSVVEMWQAKRNSDGSITARAVVTNDITDEGIYPNWHGVRAYGGSAIAGLIRAGELTNGIRHALAIAVEQQSLNRNGPGGKGFVWPASACDNNNAYSSTGNIYMGSLLAIPPTVDLRAAGLRGPTLELAIACQDYGVYITDCTGSNLSFYAEPAALAETEQVGRGEASKVVALLQVVSNNTPQTIGGGGKRRRAAAPPFALPGQVIKDGGLPPAVTSEASDATLDPGAPLRLAITATGSEPLTYRWRRSGVGVGGNAPELAIAAVRPIDAGTYVCTITNAYGKVASRAVKVQVRGGPAVASARPPAEVLKAWNARLLSALRAAGTRRLPQYRSEVFKATVGIREIAEDATLSVIIPGGGSMQVSWAQLRDTELAGIACDLAKPGDAASQALAAYFLLLSGDSEGADARLRQAGAEADAVQALFPR